MMLSTFLILILATILYDSLIEVRSAGLTNSRTFQKPTLLGEDNVEHMPQQVEFLNSCHYKFETLSTIIKKMDNSIQDLQEKSHTWAIFHHHINSWNDGIRILENKLDLLKRTYEDQQQQLQKLELIMNNKANYNDRHELIDELKQFFDSERKVTSEISSKITNIIRHLEKPTLVADDKKLHRTANIMAPLNVPTTNGFCVDVNHKVEQRLNKISLQMAQQKDIKQLTSLERRNSKNLENINQVLSDQLDKQDEITIRLQKSNECCYSLSGELTTFTESSDILLKRIEKLMRNVEKKLNDIEVTTNNDNNANEIVNDYINENIDIAYETNVLTEDEDSTNDNSENDITTEISDFDNSQDVEFMRPNLKGCHELVYEMADNANDSMGIDGIYKFSTPDINESERDFFERYCVFPYSTNDMGVPWTVIQRRGPYGQQENFNRSWSEYRNGFGQLSRDFWFGNEFIHRLVYYDDYELRIELEDFNGTQKWAEYSTFRLDSEKYNYNLLIGEYRGTVKDAMKYHNDNDFSTYDRRNDKTVDACCSCALSYASGWWFDNCSEANLNGIYHFTPLGHNYIGIMWELWHGDYSLKKTRMMIRPRNLGVHNNTKHSQGFKKYTEDP